MILKIILNFDIIESPSDRLPFHFSNIYQIFDWRKYNRVDYLRLDVDDANHYDLKNQLNSPFLIVIINVFVLISWLTILYDSPIFVKSKNLWNVQHLVFILFIEYFKRKLDHKVKKDFQHYQRKNQILKYWKESSSCVLNLEK